MNFRFAINIVVTLLLAHFLSPGEVEAQADAINVQFLESREINLALPPDQDQVSAQVTVIHNSPTPIDITLKLIQFSNEENISLPEEAIINLPHAVSQIEAGKEYVCQFAFKRVAGLGGLYTGELVAVGSNGSVARLALKLDVQSEASSVLVEPDDGVNPTYLTEFNRQTVNFVPSLFASSGYSGVRPIHIDIDKQYSSSPRIVGELASDRGPIALVWQDGTQLAVRDLQQAGKYIGNVDVQPGAEGGEIKLQVLVRDHPFYAIAALILGLLIAYWMERYVQVVRPRGRLKKRLDELKQKAIKQQNTLTGELPADWPPDWAKFRIYEAPKPKDGANNQLVEPPSLLASEALKIQQKFRDAESDAERKKWAVDGEEVAKIEGYLVSLQSIYNLAKGIHRQYKDLKSNIADFDTLPLGQQTRELLVRDGLINSQDALAQLLLQFERVGKFMNAFYELFFWLPLLAKDAGEDQERVREWQKTMKSPLINNLGVVEAIDKEAKELASTLSRGMKRRGQSVDVLVRESLSITRFLDAVSRRIRHSDVISETPEETVKRLSDLELHYRLVSGLVVLGTGFYTLYLANPTFGSPYDYLNILLWGTAVSAGFQVARSLFPRLNT